MASFLFCVVDHNMKTISVAYPHTTMRIMEMARTEAVAHSGPSSNAPFTMKLRIKEVLINKVQGVGRKGNPRPQELVKLGSSRRPCLTSY